MEQTTEPERDEEQRECNDKINKNLSEPTTITFDNNDFAPEPASPIKQYFSFLPSIESDIEQDLAAALVHSKQHKLAVLRERF